MRSSCTLTKILGPKNKGVTSLTFRGHVTSSVTERKMEEGKKGRGRGKEGKGKVEGEKEGKGEGK